MFAKIFNQIYDSSIVENPETRFTFMDLLILADKNGVVDMTHEAIARRTNRPLELVKKTIVELEGSDPRSRTPDADGARIFRLDDHRDWGWGIVNYDYFRKLASQEQRREKTKLRTQKWRQKLRESSPVTHGDASKRSGDDSPSASASASASEGGVRGGFKRPTQTELAKIITNEAEAQKFLDYYNSNGWKVGRVPMKDWQASARNWIRRNQSTQPAAGSWKRFNKEGRRVDEYGRIMDPNQIRQEDEYYEVIKPKYG